MSDVSMSQSLGHDPLCEWSTPCIHGENQRHLRDTENLAVPDATYCWMCGVDCNCDLIRMVRKDENRKVNHLRRRIERLTDKANRWRDEAAELRKQLREKP